MTEKPSPVLHRPRRFPGYRPPSASVLLLALTMLAVLYGFGSGWPKYVRIAVAVTPVIMVLTQGFARIAHHIRLLRFPAQTEPR